MCKLNSTMEYTDQNGNSRTVNCKPSINQFINIMNQSVYGMNFESPFGQSNPSWCRINVTNCSPPGFMRACPSHPDQGGYFWTTFEDEYPELGNVWVDIESIGTELVLDHNDQFSSEIIQLPFEFQFFDENYGSLHAKFMCESKKKLFLVFLLKLNFNYEINTNGLQIQNQRKKLYGKSYKKRISCSCLLGGRPDYSCGWVYIHNANAPFMHIFWHCFH